ncbi:MAG: hypothetical protein WCK91_02010 [bacterium]
MEEKDLVQQARKLVQDGKQLLVIGLVPKRMTGMISMGRGSLLGRTIQGASRGRIPASVGMVFFTEQMGHAVKKKVVMQGLPDDAVVLTKFFTTGELTRIFSQVYDMSPEKALSPAKKPAAISDPKGSQQSTERKGKIVASHNVETPPKTTLRPPLAVPAPKTLVNGSGAVAVQPQRKSESPDFLKGFVGDLVLAGVAISELLAENQGLRAENFLMSEKEASIRVLLKEVTELRQQLEVVGAEKAALSTKAARVDVLVGENARLQVRVTQLEGIEAENTRLSAQVVAFESDRASLASVLSRFAGTPSPAGQ